MHKVHAPEHAEVVEKGRIFKFYIVWTW